MKLSAKLSLCVLLGLVAVGCTSNQTAQKTQASAGNTTLIDGHHLHAQTNVALQADPTLTQGEAANAANDADDTSAQ